MKNSSRRIIIFVVTVVIFVSLYIGYSFFVASRGSKLPQDFVAARSESSVISEKIIMSSKDIASLVASLESPTTTSAQVSSTLGEVTLKVSEVKKQALDFSNTLATMTRSLSEINSPQAVGVALQSISKSVGLVNHLITYTDEVNRLTVLLRLRLHGGTQNGKEITKLVNQINSEISAINNLSEEAKTSMQEFDSLLR